MFLRMRLPSLAFGLLLLLPATHVVGADERPDDLGPRVDDDAVSARVRDAIGAAVRARMGDDVQIAIGQFHVRGLDPAKPGEGPRRIVAVPDAGARVGGFVRFLLSEDGGPGGARGRRVGSADVELHVTLPHLRARHALKPRAIVTAADVEITTGDVGRLPLAPLPDEHEVIGARLLRPVIAGQPIAASMIAAAPLVRSGDEVQTIVRVGAIEARGTAIAAQAGTLGEEIRLVTADSRRALKGRVVGEREVEVIHEQ